MSNSGIDNDQLLSALDKIFSKYFEEKGVHSNAKKPTEVFYETYLEAQRDEDEAGPKDWDGNTGSILTFVRVFFASLTTWLTFIDLRLVSSQRQ